MTLVTKSDVAVPTPLTAYITRSDTSVKATAAQILSAVLAASGFQYPFGFVFLAVTIPYKRHS